jgi:hypothetical protein
MPAERRSESDNIPPAVSAAKPDGSHENALTDMYLLKY